jgi:hypothetical protein
VGFDQTFVIAQWDQPLEELTINGRLGDGECQEPDTGISWRRKDGWQCFAPMGGYYDGELVPPVIEIAAETGGPVLGIGVARSDYYELSFVEGGELRKVAYGPYEGRSSKVSRREMIGLWGDPWEVGAARSLSRWAESLADVSWQGLAWIFGIPHLMAEEAMFDLLGMLTLMPDEDDPNHGPDSPMRGAWWTTIPDVVYAIEPGDLARFEPRAPREAWGQRDLLLGFTASGVGVWSRTQPRWTLTPTRDEQAVLASLSDQLRGMGW